MPFNPLEYLKDGEVKFIFHCTEYDYNHLIENIRKSPNRIEIINGFLPKLKKDLPSFCFNVIYDIPEFSKEAYDLFNIKNITPEMLKNLLNNSPLGLRILYENFDAFLSSNQSIEYFNYIVKYVFDSNNRQLIYKLSRYSNLHIRYKFMDYLIKNHPNQIDIIYDDITKYTSSITYEPYEQLTFFPELMDIDDISKLAITLLVNNRETDYKKLKEFILKNYKYNYLASELLEDKFRNCSNMNNSNRKKREHAFNEDADTLFKTSANYRFVIFLKYKTSISQELLDNFAENIKYFIKNDKNYDLDLIYYKGLGHLLEEWTEKYMDLSKNKDYGFIGNGTTCDCFRIGDYVIKLVKTKWSYEDVICPNIYLINKNYEEIYLRNEIGIVNCGLEVQKYLIRKANNIDHKYFNYFDLELNKLGYRRTDTLTKGICGENTMLLDTYLDADCQNPEKLPTWFKEYPIVLIDRDRIYPKYKIHIKQLRSCM